MHQVPCCPDECRVPCMHKAGGTRCTGAAGPTLSCTLPSVTLAGAPRSPLSAAITSTNTAVGSAPERTGMRTDSCPSTVPMAGTRGLCRQDIRGQGRTLCSNLHGEVLNCMAPDEGKAGGEGRLVAVQLVVQLAPDGRQGNAGRCHPLGLCIRAAACTLHYHSKGLLAVQHGSRR